MKKFVVTIARGYGSGGRTIGQMLAEKLGVNYYDKDISRIASEDSGINEALFAQHDEKKQGLFKKTKVYDGKLIPPESSSFVSPENLFAYQAKTIKELAEKESCIIVGRCGDYVLKGTEGLIRAFIWAEPDACVENAMRVNKFSDPDEARKMIEKIDKQRSTYYKQHTGHEWSDVRNYDVCLNSSELGFDKCVEILCDYIEIKLK